MPRAPRKLQICRQQKHILLLALFLLKHNCHQTRPETRQVLNFIRIKNLLLIREEDREPVAGGEPAWENKIRWRRQDLQVEGSLLQSERGIWQISPSGELRIVKWCAIMNHFAAITPDWTKRLEMLEMLFEEKIVITGDTVLAGISAYTIGTRLFPASELEVPDTIKGKIQL